MESTNQAPVFVLMSPAAANQLELRESIELAREQGMTMYPRCLWEAQDSERLIQEVVESAAERVLVAGGDGTINLVCGAFVAAEWNGVIGLVPLGTGNDLARTLCLDKLTITDAFFHGLRAEAYPIDVCLVNERPFFNLISCGAGAQATADAMMTKKMGALGYSLAAVAAMFSAENFKAKLKWSSGEWEGSLMGLCMGNGKFAGGGVKVCPDASLDDGQIDLTAFTGETVTECMTQLFELWLAGSSERILQVKSPRFEIEILTPTAINVDGEPMESQHLIIEISKTKLRMVQGTAAEVL